MSLHGPIKVNDVEVGYWSAQRIVTGDPNIYRCVVDHTPEGWRHWSGEDRRPASRHSFTIEHRYEDGALALAAKVLGHVVPTPTEPTTQEDGL